MQIKSFFKKNIEATQESIKCFKEQPFLSLGQLIPVGMVMTSTIGFIVAIVMFIFEGGISNQISGIKSDLWKGVSNGFTYGTSSVLTSGVVSTIVLLLLLVELIVLVITYCKSENKTKRIIACVCLGIGSILATSVGLILAAGFEYISMSEQAQLNFAKMLTIFIRMSTESIVNTLKIIGVIGLVSFIVFIVLMLISEHRWMIKNSVIALCVSFIVLPLLVMV